MQPACFSSRLRPGQAMRYATRPLASWQMQARQVPLRHELTTARPARSAACSSGKSAGASKQGPPGALRAWKIEAGGAGGAGASGDAGGAADENLSGMESNTGLERRSCEGQWRVGPNLTQKLAMPQCDDGERARRRFNLRDNSSPVSHCAQALALTVSSATICCNPTPPDSLPSIF